MGAHADGHACQQPRATSEMHSSHDVMHAPQINTPGADDTTGNVGVRPAGQRA